MSRNSTAAWLADKLLDQGCVTADIRQHYDFVSGLRSPVYVDNRRLISLPEARAPISDAIATRISEAFPEAGSLVGIATAGIPWASWAAERLQLPLLYVRPLPKDRGLGKQVEGDLDSCASPVLVEDLVTTGLSSRRAAEALASADRPAIGLVSLFSYQMPFAKDRFREQGLQHEYLVGLSDLVDGTHDSFSEEELRAIRKWRDGSLSEFVPSA